jgi:xylulokinase
MILCLDIGTSSVKAGLFTETGKCSASGTAAIAMKKNPDPRIHEIPAGSWITAVRELSGRLLAGRPGLDCAVVSGNGPTLVPVDAAGVPLADAATWLDRRAVAEADAVSAVAGRFIDPSFSLPKALWFMRNRPELYGKTASFFSCPEYVIRVMTGRSLTVLPAAGFERYIWDDASITALGMDPQKFPPFVRLGENVGTLNAAGSAATGIPEGTRVVTGGPDFIASLIGTGTTKPGRACDRAGTSEGINLCSVHGVEDPRLLCLPHVIEPFVNVSGMISTSGKAVEWFKRISGRESEHFDDYFEDVCASVPGASKLIFLPYLSGERSPIWDPSARGVFLGMTLGHGRKEMSRAVVESTAFAMRDIIEVMESLGSSVAELRVVGTPGKSPVWNQIKADITGRPIILPREEDAELLGDACIGLTATGRYSTIAEAAEDTVGIGRIFQPDQSNRHLYDELFGVYRSAYEALKPVFRQIEAIEPEGSAE